MFEDIQELLATVRLADTACEIFGADKHRYRSTPVSPAQIEAFDLQIGVRLPEEYRQFLTSVGYGAGSYYGIWSPGEVLNEYQSLVQDLLVEEGIKVHTSESFPFSVRQAGEIVQRISEGVRYPCAEALYPSSGCIPICRQGCTMWSVLVTNGELTGMVWDVRCFVGYDGEWCPARRAPGLLRAASEHQSLPGLAGVPTFVQ